MRPCFAAAAAALLSCLVAAACGGVTSVGAIGDGGGADGSQAGSGSNGGGSGGVSSSGSTTGDGGGPEGGATLAQCFGDMPRTKLDTSAWFAAGADPADYTLLPSGSQALVSSKSGSLDPSKDFGTLMNSVAAGAYTGQTRFSAAVRVTSVTSPSWSGLWMRVDDAAQNTLAFDNMQNRPIQSMPGVKYEIVLDVAKQAYDVAFGLLLAGSGTAVADDAAFEPVAADGTYSSNPTGWLVSPPAAMNADASAGACGRPVAHVVNAGQTKQLGQVGESIAADEFRGKRVRLQATVETSNLFQGSVLMEVDDEQRNVLAVDDMHDRLIQGTTPWQTYSLVLDVPGNAQQIAFALRTIGSGDAWIDVVHFDVVDSSVPTTGH